MTDDLTIRVLIPELFQLLAAQAQQHFLGTLFTAVTLVLHLALIQNIGVEACQCKVHHILGGLAFPKQFSDGRHCGDVLLQLGNLGIGGTGQQLQQEAARAGNGQVSIHQHTQSADGRHLLTVSIVAGQILGDLAGDQRHLAHSGFFLQAVVTDDSQHAIFAHSTAHIQMAVCFQRQLYQRVVDAALDIAGAIGTGNNRAGGAAARHTQRNGIAIVLEHGAHQGRTGEQAAQGCTAGRTGMVQLLGRADDLSGVHTAEHNTAVFRNTADQIRHFLFPPIGYTA